MKLNAARYDRGFADGKAGRAPAEEHCYLDYAEGYLHGEQVRRTQESRRGV